MMKNNNDFYIGWKEEMPKGYASLLKKILIPLFILLPILVFIGVYFQQPFSSNTFEFGKSTDITGIYYEAPLPMLIADKGTITDTLSPNIILVGYGKLGAKGIFQEIEKKTGSLNGKKIMITGTLIYGEGKTLLELTKEADAFVKVVNEQKANPIILSATTDISLAGEIIDPKCYFGVMKPGEGKVHKSCAIRCISGGIPPVFKTKDAQGKTHYYLMFDQEGKAINKQVLPFVAEAITLRGTTNRLLDWKMLYTNTETFKARK